MALKKLIVEKNGIQVLYHRIGRLMIDFEAKKITVFVYHYMSEAKRQQEKMQVLDTENAQEKYDLIKEENLKPDGERDIGKIQQLAEAYNDFFKNQNVEKGNFFAHSREYEIELLSNTNISDIYAALKTLETFCESDDC